MISNIPPDLRAESLLGYLPRDMRRIEAKGTHKRNAYEDVTGIADDGNGGLTIMLARNGMYDILPESLFHPIDRFDNIPANEYKERFKEECERQQAEEENARKYFQPIDNFLIELNSIVNESKQNREYSAVLENIICDRLPERYSSNRFIRKAKEFMPLCRHIRGDKGLFSLMLRHILFDEQISISEHYRPVSVTDSSPRYNHRLEGSEEFADRDFFLGSEFDENIITYDIRYWKEEECDGSFLLFVKEMEVFGEFLNDYLMGMETQLRFNITKTALPVRLSDDVFLTYLDYNTNL